MPVVFIIYGHCEFVGVVNRLLKSVHPKIFVVPIIVICSLGDTTPKHTPIITMIIISIRIQRIVLSFIHVSFLKQKSVARLPGNLQKTKSLVSTDVYYNDVIVDKVSDYPQSALVIYRVFRGIQVLRLCLLRTRSAFYVDT